MTILAETPTGWNTPSTFGGADSPIYNASVLTASAAGTAENIIMTLPLVVWDSTGSTFKICVYRQSTLALVGTATFVAADGTGLVSKSINTPFSVANGEQFYVLQVNDGTLTLNADATGFMTFTAASGSFASPPATIAPSTDATNVRAQFRASIDGTLSGPGVNTSSFLITRTRRIAG
jgi:hypothetical protein